MKTNGLYQKKLVQPVFTNSSYFLVLSLTTEENYGSKVTNHGHEDKSLLLINRNSKEPVQCICFL